MECDEMFEKLKEEVCEKNLMLAKTGLITLTFGNLSVYDREAGVVAIKPSGVGYDELTPDKIPVMSIDGSVVEGNYRPSSDTETHLEITEISVRHAALYIPIRNLRRRLLRQGVKYRRTAQLTAIILRSNTLHEGNDWRRDGVGLRKKYRKGDSRNFCREGRISGSGVLVCSHGPFVWGKNSNEALTHAVVWSRWRKWHSTRNFSETGRTMSRHLLDRHFFRKHGKNAYYGQKNT